MLTVVYDNYAAGSGLPADWGFACVVAGLEKTILFDTGAKGDILLGNMQGLGVAPEDIDALVLSHEHWDHTGGLDELVSRNSGLEVYVPACFSQALRDSIRKASAGVLETEGPTKICAGAQTGGVLGGDVPEQALCLTGAKGTVVVTGCAHPGILNVVEHAASNYEPPLRAALGGFHLYKSSASEIREVAEGLKELGLQQAGPCHCSGDQARKIMAEVFGKDYIELNVGARVDL